MADYTGVTAAVPTTDLDTARKFYEGTLGLTAVSENPGGVTYEVAGARLLVFITSESGGGATRALLTVWDTAKAVADLKDKGVTFEVYPDLPMATWEGEVAVWHDPSGSMPDLRSAWFKDPAGNIIAIGDNN